MGCNCKGNRVVNQRLRKAELAEKQRLAMLNVTADGVEAQNPEPIVTPSGMRMFYIYCPACGVVITKRTDRIYLTKYRCTTCGGKTAHFERPPSANKLNIIKQRMLGS